MSGIDNDRMLAKRMLRGHEEAFEEFFEGHFPGLYRFALQRVNLDGDVAEEVAQAAICKAISKLKSYRGEATLFTWLCTFCRYEISAYFRKHDRGGRRIELVEDQPEIRSALESLPTGFGEEPAGVLARKEVSRLVQVALDRLPVRYGDALEWKYIDGLSVREIAGRLHLSEKAAESLLTRARNAFREGFATLTSEPQRLSEGTT